MLSYLFFFCRLVDGEHTERWSDSKKTHEGEGPLSAEQIALMQTQDINYINSKRISEKRKLEKLQSRYFVYFFSRFSIPT